MPSLVAARAYVLDDAGLTPELVSFTNIGGEIDPNQLAREHVIEITARAGGLLQMTLSLFGGLHCGVTVTDSWEGPDLDLLKTFPV